MSLAVTMRHKYESARSRAHLQ